MLMERDRDIMQYIERHGFITIKQCALIFFKNTSRAYDLARRRLSKIVEMNKDIKPMVNPYTKEKMYTWLGKKVTSHAVYLYNFYAELISCGCDIIKFVREPRWLDGAYRSDAFIDFKDFAGNRRIICVEIDVTHTTDISKYEEIYEGKEIQAVYGKDNFPMIIIIGLSKGVYKGDLDVRFLDFQLTNFTNAVFGNG